MKPGQLVPSVALCLALPGGPLAPLSNVYAQTAQQPPPTSTTTSTQTQTTDPKTPPPPDDLARIREGLLRPSVLKMDGQPRIYVNIFGKWPTFAEMTKG